MRSDTLAVFRLYIVELVDIAPTSPVGTLLLAAVFISLAALQLWRPLRPAVAPPLRDVFTNLAIAAAGRVRVS